VQDLGAFAEGKVRERGLGTLGTIPMGRRRCTEGPPLPATVIAARGAAGSLSGS
jgi:hypothetical protein